MDGKQNQRPLLGIHSEYCYDVPEIGPNHELLPRAVKLLNACGESQIDSHQEDCIAQEQQQVGNSITLIITEVKPIVR